jgi:hypothetical protein
MEKSNVDMGTRVDSRRPEPHGWQSWLNTSKLFGFNVDNLSQLRATPSDVPPSALSV